MVLTIPCPRPQQALGHISRALRSSDKHGFAQPQHKNTRLFPIYDYDYDYEMVLLRHTISTMYHGIIFKSCKNTIYYNEVCHRRTNKESVLSADVGPPETNIIYRSKCNMSIYIIIGGYIIKIEIWFT